MQWAPQKGHKKRDVSECVCVFGGGGYGKGRGD